MKIRAILISLLLALSGTAVAAEDGSSPNAGKTGKNPDRMARMQEYLELSDAQIQEMRQIRQNGGSREDVHAVLTDEQRARAKEMHQKGKKGKGGKGGKGGKPRNGQGSQPQIETDDPA